MARTLPEILSRNRTGNPSGPALLAAGRPVLDHATLAAWVDRFSAGLRAFGIAREDRVVLVLPEGPGMASAFLGTAAAAVAAPLNPAYGEGDLEFYLDDLGPAAVVVAAGSPGPAAVVARRRGVRVVEVFEPPGHPAGWLEFDGMPGSAVGEVSARPDDVALVLHTSGTTSRPKQVPLTHGNLAASAEAVAETLGLVPADRCLGIMPLFHIHGLVGGLLSSLTAGASLAATAGFRPDVFLAALRDLAPTWYTGVPTMHQAIVAAAIADPGRIGGHGLRFIRSSSAALPTVVLGDLERVFGVPVIESYGMTEASHQMASNPRPPGVRKTGSVGPAAGPEVAILGGEGALLAAGERGEVVIRGPGVTSGYVANPEATAAAFVDGWFRTGDEGYLDADGYLFLTGRLKEMVNRGGEKVAPVEVDEVLLRHPAVAQAVAFAVPHPTLGEDLAAAVVLRPGAAVEERELRDFAVDRLPAFKVPTRVVTVAAIPKGPTGKVQRIGLAKRLEAELKEPADPAADGPESEIAAVFAEVLEAPAGGIGRHSNFFSAGGDSLRAATAVMHLARRFGRDLPPGLLFRCPTPALLSAALVATDDPIESLARDLEGLSPEEIERLLKEAEDGG